MSVLAEGQFLVWPLAIALLVCACRRLADGCRRRQSFYLSNRGEATPRRRIFDDPEKERLILFNGAGV
jgi:hypothetical protein